MVLNSVLDSFSALPNLLLMPEVVKTIPSQVLKLPPDEGMRLDLARMESFERGDAASAEEAWSNEISRRIAAFDAGQTKSIPAEEVFHKLLRIAPDR